MTDDADRKMEKLEEEYTKWLRERRRFRERSGMFGGAAIFAFMFGMAFLVHGHWDVLKELPRMIGGMLSENAVRIAWFLLAAGAVSAGASVNHNRKGNQAEAKEDSLHAEMREQRKIRREAREAAEKEAAKPKPSRAKLAGAKLTAKNRAGRAHPRSSRKKPA